MVCDLELISNSRLPGNECDYDQKLTKKMNKNETNQVLSTSSTRRQFLKQGALGSAAWLAAPFAAGAGEMPHRHLATDQTILFQGDSITDAGRDRGQYYANNLNGLGKGYVYQISAELLGEHPNAGLHIYNRGISGHKVFQLAERWEDDCLNLRPDVLSILIGVNDFWHMLNGNYDGTVAVYDQDYRQLLERTKKALPEVRLIICEPFVVKGGTAVSSERWQTEFPLYRNSARQIAGDFGAAFVPFQQVFDEALKQAPAEYWCPDGVHPSIAGAHLMKKAWLKAYQRL